MSANPRSRTARKHAVRAIVFQDGDWLCAQCLEYDLVAQAKTLSGLSRALQHLILSHVAVRLRHDRQPFRDLPRAPEKYWTMFRQSRLALPAPMFKLGAFRSDGIVIAPPRIRIATPSARSQVAAGFSQMPTLGELIARARTYGYTRHIIRVPELRARITYLRRGEGSTLKAVVESLCQRLEIPAEDFGL